MPEGKGYKPKKKDKYDKPSYADRLILGGLKMVKEVKSGAKKQFKKDVGKVKSVLKRKKKKPISTTRTKSVSGGLSKAGVTGKEIARLRRKK